MKYLVTGANGFIGKALCTKLLNKNHDVTKLKRNCLANYAKHSLYDFDCLIHLAGLAHLTKPKTLNNYPLYRDANIILTIKVGEIAKNLRVKKFIFVSSIGVNGNKTDNKPFTEEDDVNPQNGYSLSKLHAEIALKNLFEGSSTQLVIIRPPLVYGPNAKANFKHLISLCKLPLPLPFGAVNNRRSLVGIDNLCDFIELCSKHPAAGNQTFLISDNFDVSTPYLVATIRELLNKRSLLVPIPPWILKLILKTLGKSNLNDQLLSDLQIDITKAMNLLGWNPELSFREGIKRAIEK